MFSLYSKNCEYTLRALICGLESSREKSFRVEDACREAGVPESFTRKGFQRLVRGKILKTVRGPGGGYLLEKRPEDVNVLEVVKIIDGKNAYENCVMGLSRCGDAAPCPIHPVWKKMKQKLIQDLGQTSLLQMMRAAKAKARILK
jgi:Rrf2 family transcriptional regulator, iron-sulfur cluster assembly transcription factor